MKFRALRRLTKPDRPQDTIYAQLAEADRGRVWNGKRWVKVEPRDIVAATQRVMAEEARYTNIGVPFGHPIWDELQ